MQHVRSLTWVVIFYLIKKENYFKNIKVFFFSRTEYKKSSQLHFKDSVVQNDGFS